MREIVITRHGAPDVMEERERPTPDPGPGEVRIRVKAAGVNFADVLGQLVAYGAQDILDGLHRNDERVRSSLSQMPRFDPLDLMSSSKGVFGLNLGHLWKERRYLASAMEEWLTDFAGGRLKPVIAKTLPLARAADAHTFLQDRANIGKVVLTCWGSGFGIGDSIVTPAKAGVQHGFRLPPE